MKSRSMAGFAMFSITGGRALCVQRGAVITLASSNLIETLTRETSRWPGAVSSGRARRCWACRSAWPGALVAAGHGGCERFGAYRNLDFGFARDGALLP